MTIPKKTALMMGAGLVLLAALASSEYLWAPQSLEMPARFAYRLAFFLTLPFRAAVILFLPQVHHHWSTAHTVCVGLGTPFFYWALWEAFKALSRLRPRPEIAVSADKTSRRRFLSTTVKSAAALTVLGGASAGVYGALIEPQRLKVRRYTLRIADLPETLEGLRIVQVSDTHYGPFVYLSYLRGAIAQVNALHPDLIFLTGDYVHRSRKAIEPGIAIFGELESRYGTVAVLGNHEHWEDPQRCREALDREGIRVIDNDRVFLDGEMLHSDLERPGSICLAGVGDLWEDEVRFDKALQDVPPSMARLVLSHNPDVAEGMAADLRVDSLFSGHTHGGQVRLPINDFYLSPSRYGLKYLGGECQGPQCPVIVSRGIGLAGVPMRFGVVPELVSIQLSRLDPGTTA